MNGISAQPQIEIISSGTEILQGLYADANAQWLSEQLDARGYAVRYHHAVPDQLEALTALLRRALEQSDLTIFTGGLGPTADDLTREAVARVTGRELVFDERALELIRVRFARRNRPLPESNQVQAWIPRGGVIMYNQWGTAPGFILEAAPPLGALIALPGPPREMQPMFETLALPWLLRNVPPVGVARRRVLKVFGRPESELNELLLELFEKNPAVGIGLRAHYGQIAIRVNARAGDERQALALLDEFEAQIRRRIGDADIFARDESSLEQALAELLLQRGLRVACAESCTGGLISALLTGVPGSSNYFGEGFVTYSNDAKIRQLGVSAETLQRCGAVSAETAREMAAGARARSGADLAVSVTGIAGPAGGSPEKPVGLTWFGLADASGATAVKALFGGDRNWNRELAALYALDLLRRKILSGAAAP